MVGVAKFINLRERLEIRRKSMVKKDKNGCLAPRGKNTGCCKVESLISIDERGQMVLPKELRDRANIRAGDKLAIISWDKGGEVCCIYLIKAEHLAERVKDFLGPMMKGVAAT
jgi:AbrB family looped-hinge helix DNA binding protein